MAYTNIAKVVQANNTFAFSMYKELCKKEGDKNLFFSPMSITAALAMTHLGAAGKTADEIKSALHAKDFKDERFHAALSSLNEKLNTKEESACMVRMANRVFVRMDYAVKDTYVAATKKHYAAEAQLLDFVNETEKSRTVINNWVEDQTNQKIKDLIPEGVITDSTAIVLANAIYFKGQWLEVFDPENTRKMNWTLPSKNETEVDMMSKEYAFKNSVNENIDGIQYMYLEMPYQGNELSMGIILPVNAGELELLQEKLNINCYKTVVNSASENWLMIFIPKFKIGSQANLKELLNSLGINEAFKQGSADFSNITDAPDTHISEVIHKAFVEVNEKGTEAAAASCAFAVDCVCNEFCADHPFIFFIKDNPTGAILFMGHVMNPNV